MGDLRKMEKAILVWLVLALKIVCLGQQVLCQTDSPYTHNAFLDASEKYQVFWKFDEEYITFEVHVKTNGYVGFGFSPNGKMLHSDCVIGWLRDGETFFQDRYAEIDTSEPVIDDHSDYELIFGQENETHTVFAFKRNIETCDDQDRKLKSGTTRIIWSFHSDDRETETGLPYHGINRGSRSVYLFEPILAPTFPKNVTTHDFLNSNVSVPGYQDTTYWCQAFPYPDFGGEKQHIIKYEAIIQEGHESLVHHFLAFECNHDVNESYHGYGSECGHPNMPDDLNDCNQLIIGWAIGGQEFYFPEHVGYPIGGEDGPKVLFIQTHYDNPECRYDYVDSSGLKITYTNELREMDAGILMAGVGVGINQAIPPGSSDFTSIGYCSQDCISENLNGTEEVQIFSGFLHSHLAGVAISAQLFRNGQPYTVIAEDDSYDFNFQEARYFSEPITMTPNDTIVVGCKYDVQDRENFTYGGYSTVEEMCLTFIYYYPKKPFTQCMSYVWRESSLSSVVGDTVSGEENEQGAFVVQLPEEYSGMTYTQILEATTWNDTTRKALEEAQTMSLSSRFCESSENEFLPYQPIPIGNFFKEEEISQKCMEYAITTTTNVPIEASRGIPFSSGSVYFYGFILAIALFF